MKVTSMRGKVLDMTALIAKNAHMQAVGNASMNARGDIITKGGRIVKPREQIAMEYHESNPAAVKTVGLASLSSEMFMTPAEAVASIQASNKKIAQENATILAARAAEMKPTQAPTVLTPHKSADKEPVSSAKKTRKLIIEEDDAADM